MRISHWDETFIKGAREKGVVAVGFHDLASEKNQGVTTVVPKTQSERRWGQGRVRNVNHVFKAGDQRPEQFKDPTIL